MLRENKKLRLIFSIFMAVASLLSFALFVYNSSLAFADHSWFFTDKYFDPYTNVNVFNGWANLLYVTYLSGIFVNIFYVVDCVQYLFSGKVWGGTVRVVVVAIQLFVMLAYVGMETLSGGHWGLWADAPIAYHTFSCNLFAHVAYPLLVFVDFLLLHVGGGNGLSYKKPSVLMISCLLVYYAVVKIVGETCFPFSWFPYPIFTGEAVWMLLFGSLQNYRPFWAIALLIIALLLLVALLVCLVWLVTKLYNGKSQGQEHTQI